MFYYIKDGVCIGKSETQIKIDDTIKEIELDQDFENPFFEKGEIIEYNESQDFFHKQKQEELEKKEEIEKQELEKKEEIEKQELEKKEEIEKLQEYKNSIEYKKSEIEKEFKDSIAILTAGYSPEEISTWERKIQEAKKVITGGQSEFLSALLLDGETIEGMAKIILQRADIYALEYAKIERIKRQKIKELEQI